MLTAPGHVCLTKDRLYFQPSHPSLFSKRAISLKIERVTQMFKRRHQLQNLGLEVTASRKEGSSKPDKKVLYLVFDSEETRDLLYSKLQATAQTASPEKQLVTSEQDLAHFTKQWASGADGKRHLTNFEYLMTLNQFAQRSFQDLS
mmetsp:Transcript_42680/g.65474  ORF Transcript_42680/g.65474 Transcript_42680/m.65474 type:complete len:146 (+) Transcript_42680:652-1089(+)